MNHSPVPLLMLSSPWFTQTDSPLFTVATPVGNHVCSPLFLVGTPTTLASLRAEQMGIYGAVLHLTMTACTHSVPEGTVSASQSLFLYVQYLEYIDLNQQTTQFMFVSTSIVTLHGLLGKMLFTKGARPWSKPTYKIFSLGADQCNKSRFHSWFVWLFLFWPFRACGDSWRKLKWCSVPVSLQV